MRGFKELNDEWRKIGIMTRGIGRLLEHGEKAIPTDEDIEKWKIFIKTVDKYRGQLIVETYESLMEVKNGSCTSV